MGQQQRGNGATETPAIDQSIAMGHWGRSNKGHRTVIAMGQWGTRLIDRVLYCNSNGATAMAAIDRLQRGNGNKATGAMAMATAMAMGHRSRGNRTVIAMGQWQWQWGNDRSIVFYIAAQNVDNSGWKKVCKLCG
jgi:hypothetical protein